jgi:Ca-activated chloride channel family protein
VGFVPRIHGIRVLLFFSHSAFWIGCICIIIALAGPAVFLREKVFLTRGIDMVLVLDESPSMAARDFQPVNRFETAREVIRRFVRNRENDPIGLVSFSYEAVLRVPPTLDYEHLIKKLDELSIMDLGDGTAIGMGLSVACLHLRSSTAAEKVIILLTDGKNNTGEISPETAADIAAQMGIRVYTVGIGGKDETPIEFSDPKTGKFYRGTLEEGFDEELLRKIAENSKGNYFYAGNPGTLGSIFQAIDALETIERRVRIEVRSNPIHGRFILLGLLLIFADFLIRKKFLREVL